MKIAFMGAAGTGKSTLAKFVSASMDIPFVDVGSRSVANDMGFARPYDVDAAGKRDEFQIRLLAKKMEQENGMSSLVTDRTTVDHLAYWHVHSYVNLKMLSIVPGDMGDYRSAAIAHMNRYDVVFWCPFEVFNDMADDPVREKDSYYHLMTEAIMVGLCVAGKVSTRIIRVVKSDLEERKNLVATAIAKPLASPLHVVGL